MSDIKEVTRSVLTTQRVVSSGVNSTPVLIPFSVSSCGFQFSGWRSEIYLSLVVKETRLEEAFGAALGTATNSPLITMIASNETIQTTRYKARFGIRSSSLNRNCSG